MAFPRRALLLGFGLVACMLAGAASAQDFPTKPITLIVPFPPGGGTDIAARALADKMVGLSQRVVVVNRPGAGGNIGAAAVARAAPDGYTLIMATQGTHGSNASLYKEMPYDTIADFAPITLVASTPLILVTTPKIPATNLTELLAYIRAQPSGSLNYGSSSVGGSPHLAMELFKSMTGTVMEHIPYQGSAPARTALLAGDITLMFDNIPSSLPSARAGQFRAIGVSGASRTAAAPDLPTIAEAGLPGFEMVAWYGILTTAGTPQPVIRALHDAFVATLKLPEIAERMTQLGYDPVGSTPEAFAAQIKTDMGKYRQLVETAGIPKQ